MGLEIVITIIGILVAISTYFAGAKRGERQQRKQHEHEIRMERERQSKGIASKAVDEYVNMVRSLRDSGPHALTSIGLDLLGSDDLIRQAIHEMHVRSGTDPWAGQTHHVEDADLVLFFRYVREHRINFSQTSVEEVVRKLKTETGNKQHDVA